jgi:SAM-dependent methyltransferase
VIPKNQRPTSGGHLDPDSLERLVPEQLASDVGLGAETLQLHLSRYAFAAEHARRGRILDIACGVGYGSRLLSDCLPAGTEVLGVDLSEAAITHARQQYRREGLDFAVADALRFSDERGFDTIVSLETIEHLPDPDAFIDRMMGLLKPGGAFIASVPTTPSVDANPHHLHDFTAARFRRMVAPYRFEEIASLPQVQAFTPGAVLRRDDSRTRNLRTNLPSYYVRHPSSLMKRLWTTLRHGFENHYLTIAWRAGDRSG